MNRPEDYPPGLTHNGKEVFIVFDVIDRPGATVHEALKEISEKLHTKPPHRTTITPVFKVGLEFFREDTLMLTDERINMMRTKIGYGIPSSRVVELYRLYLLWKVYRHKEMVNTDLVLSTLRERRLKVWFLLLQHWNKEEIAEKLGVSLKGIQYDEEEAKRELVSKTKGEIKMEQESMVNFPPWVNRAQWEHLEGREQLDERGGMDIITYPRGTSIRQELEFFKNSFLDISPRNRAFWIPKDEIVMAQLHGHLPDKAFWERVEGSEGFIKKAKECEALLDAAREGFASASKELAPLQSVITGPVPDVYITSGWVRRVLVRALSQELGFSEPRKYYPRELKEGDFILEDEEVIYRGPDVAKAEQKHSELVKDFTESEGFSPIVNLMKDLRNLRQQIFPRIDKCLRSREYSNNYCPDCPADQARKMLKEE